MNTKQKLHPSRSSDGSSRRGKRTKQHTVDAVPTAEAQPTDRWGDSPARNELRHEDGPFTLDESGAPDQKTEPGSDNPQGVQSGLGPLGQRGQGNRQNDELAELAEGGGTSRDLESRMEEPARPFHNHPENASVQPGGEVGERPEEAHPFGPRASDEEGAEHAIREAATGPGERLPTTEEHRSQR